MYQLTAAGGRSGGVSGRLGATAGLLCSFINVVRYTNSSILLLYEQVYITSHHLKGLSGQIKSARECGTIKEVLVRSY